jgi:ribosomal protein L35AE/L33A/uncharacterized protein YgiM (DUF1202 family)
MLMKYYIARYLIIIFVFISINSEATAQDRHPQLKSILQSIQQQYAPDTHLAVFDVFYRYTKSGIVVRGEVDNIEAKNAVIRAFQNNIKGNVFDSIQVLPDLALGNNTSGIVIISIGNVHREPGQQKELLTQALMGTVVKLLKKTNGYFYIQMPDQYLGWLDTSSVYVANQSDINAWLSVPKVIVTMPAGVVYKRPEAFSKILCDVVEGCILKYFGSKNGWTSVELADGRKGFVADTLIQDLDDWNKNRVLSGENIEKTAKLFLGIPYLWGGTSVKGMDCSGFIKTVYRFNGMELNRDAIQQARQGTPVDHPGKAFQNLKKGDLLFFGRKTSADKQEHITHVAIYLENGLFIHSSGCVHYGSFNPSSKYYEKALLKNFVRARRIVQQ